MINPALGPLSPPLFNGVIGGALQNDLQQVKNEHVSAQIVRSNLHEGGIRTRRPQVEVVLAAQHCKMFGIC